MAVTFPTDLEIARQARLLPMPEIAARMGIGPHLLEPYGYDVAKIRLDAIAELADRPKAKYVVVSAITPTPLGEGKTTTTVGLGDALGRIGKRATVAIRQPSMGPTFGIKVFDRFSYRDPRSPCCSGLDPIGDELGPPPSGVAQDPTDCLANEELPLVEHGVGITSEPFEVPASLPEGNQQSQQRRPPQVAPDEPAAPAVARPE